MGSISWNGILSFSIFLFFLSPFQDSSSLVPIYHLYVWGVSAGTALSLYMSHAYGPSGDGTCWFNTDEKFWQLLFYAPVLVYFISTTLSLIICYFFVIGSSRTSDSAALRRKIFLRMMIFSLVFIICWSMPLAHRMSLFVNKDNRTLRYLEAIGITIQGFLNALVWLTNPGFYQAFKKIIASRVLRFLRLDEDKMPILSYFGVEENLQDPNQDLGKIDKILRKEIIAAVLYGIFTAAKKAEVDRESSPDKDFQPLPEVDGQDLNQRYEFIDFSPALFRKIRRSSGFTTSDYLKSLEPEAFLASLDDQKFSEGRSGSFFCFSPDKNFIIKTIPDYEAYALKDILSEYYLHLSKHPESLLIRFYGLHQIDIQYSKTVFVVVMGNIFNTNRKLHQRFDLKGSWIDRYKGSKAEGALGLDIDLNRKFYVSESVKKKLLSIIKADAQFLRQQDIMDYSLLIGVHKINEIHLVPIESPLLPPFMKKSTSVDPNGHILSRRNPLKTSLLSSNSEILPSGSVSDIELEVHQADISGSNRLKDNHWAVPSVSQDEIYFIGVIDILQKYNFGKKMERFTKVYLLRKDADGISVQPSKRYCDRFISQMAKIFLEVS
eukprot:TRINITY_DN7180_c0_g1_i1.p1 TRINITY_DN7180_c0_g1~~TRINITY_DN7180_c0_g1_i1.p1  ORF type:complete len:705 (-),score=151.69 TRINITY_DN7180_c0_g1_i1:190-2004(-)